MNTKKIPNMEGDLHDCTVWNSNTFVLRCDEE